MFEREKKGITGNAELSEGPRNGLSTLPTHQAAKISFLRGVAGGKAGGDPAACHTNVGVREE